MPILGSSEGLPDTTWIVAYTPLYIVKLVGSGLPTLLNGSAWRPADGGISSRRCTFPCLYRIKLASDATRIDATSLHLLPRCTVVTVLTCGFALSSCPPPSRTRSGNPYGIVLTPDAECCI
jgi:hypothetical protein